MPVGAQVPIIIRFPYPLFANIYLDRFDKALLKRGVKLVRYADECDD